MPKPRHDPEVGVRRDERGVVGKRCGGEHRVERAELGVLFAEVETAFEVLGSDGQQGREEFGVAPRELDRF